MQMPIQTAWKERSRPMNRIKISDSDKRLLLIFCAIVIVACSYFFIFSKGMSKAAKIEEQNTADQAKVQQMEQMEAGLPKVKRKYSADGKKAEDDYQYVSFCNDNREGH